MQKPGVSGSHFMSFLGVPYILVRRHMWERRYKLHGFQAVDLSKAGVGEGRRPSQPLKMVDGAAVHVQPRSG